MSNGKCMQECYKTCIKNLETRCRSLKTKYTMEFDKNSNKKKQINTKLKKLKQHRFGTHNIIFEIMKCLLFQSVDEYFKCLIYFINAKTMKSRKIKRQQGMENVIYNKITTKYVVPWLPYKQRFMICRYYFMQLKV